MSAGQQTIVVPINSDVVIPAQPVSDVVGVLRELLAEAERGELIAFACATVDPGQNVVARWAYNGRLIGFALMGAVSRLAFRLNEVSGE